MLTALISGRPVKYPVAAFVQPVVTGDDPVLTGDDIVRAASSTPRPNVTVRLRVSEEVALHYHQLERAYRSLGLEMSFASFLCTSFFSTWVHHLGKSDKWELIYRRGRYRCSGPACLRRDVTLHHVKYRSHGGTDHPDNLTTPCPYCHLEGEHGGRLKILPPATNPTWVLGRTPVLVIEGRDKRAAA